MRSQLTRHVLRRLLAHQGMLPPCPILAQPSLRRYPVIHRVSWPSQRRNFLGLFRKEPRIPKDLQVEPGYDMLVQYWNNRAEDLRLPPTEALLVAFREFFRYKKFNRRPLTLTQARIAHHVLDHLCQPPPPGSEPNNILTVKDLRTAQDAVLLPPRDDPDDHVELSKALYARIRKRAQLRPRPKTSEGTTEHEEHALDLAALLRALTQYGRSTEARDHLWGFWRDGKSISLGRTKSLWIPVLRGLAKEGKEADLLKMLSKMKERAGIGYTQSAHEVMTTFYAQQDDWDKMMEWYKKPIDPEAPPSYKTYDEVFRCALRNNQRQWAIATYQDLANSMESLSETHYFDQAVLLVYRWAVLLLDKGAEHIEHMMVAYSDRHPLDPRFQPKIETIHGLIEASMEKDEPYLAERFVSLIPKLGLEAKKQTYSLQIQYRLRAKDLDGAFSAYRAFQTYDVDHEDWPVLNKLIRELCAAPSPNHERVLDITSFLEQATATMEAETVVSICLTFLRNDEHYEVIDTLSLHTSNFGVRERQLICKAFVSYCLDPKVSTARVWDAYTLVRQFFPDLEVEDRAKIMDMFFDRKRADMASHVFGHMRQAKNLKNRPTLKMYVRCFEGFGRCPDFDGLKIVHNMLKMDTTITPNTKLYNALMLAYTACEEDDRALDLWKEISNSVEGPSYNSLEIVFRTYQITHRGNEMARALWEKIEKMEIDVPPIVFTSYVAALAAHCEDKDLEDARNLLSRMEDLVGERPDHYALASVWNVLQNDQLKSKFEAWANDEFPPVWEKLKKAKRRRTPMGVQKMVLPYPPVRA